MQKGSVEEVYTPTAVANAIARAGLAGAVPGQSIHDPAAGTGGRIRNGSCRRPRQRSTETFADAIARRHGIDVRVKRLSLRARGSGAVGEMTRLIGTAFDVVLREARAAGPGRPIILVIDEADALAQSREAAQMHHEDRAGVNALIRGISQIASERLPILVIMCTNRPDALDPAIRRRAAAEFDFARPNDTQRAAVLTAIFDGVGHGRPPEFREATRQNLRPAPTPSQRRAFELIGAPIPVSLL